jgi:hypothetical protein
MLEGVQAIATLLATGAGIYVALNGLRSWKREHTGKRDIELCQKVIESFYEAEQRIMELRSPISFPKVESAERSKQEGENSQDADRRDTYYVPIARYQAQREFWISFLSLKYRMRALFGGSALKPYDEIEQILREFRAAASTRYTTLYNTGELSGGLAETMQAWQRTLWDTTEDTDPLKTRVRAAIERMETICIPIVRGVEESPKWVAKVRQFLGR